MGNKFDVFISYNWNDEKFVDLIINQLKENDIKFFQDKTNLKLYDKLDSTLKDNIRNSKYLVAIISQKYLESYWCLFEAIEAISNEDLNLKFLPIMVKYNENDVTFNEDFIFESIEKLNNEIESFENKILKSKAFELSGKLKKLNFVKSNLPVIFERIQQRIYPNFKLYSKEQLIENLTNFLNHIKLNSKVDIDLDSFTNLVKDELYKIPEVSNSPTIKWETYIGKQKWKNTPLILGDKIFIGSAGKKWNESDEEDGVYCINIHTGRIEWFYSTNSDVNKISFYDGLIVGGCDDGKFFCISSKTGKEKSVVQLDSGIVSSIYKEQDHVFLTATYNGTVYIINIKESIIAGHINIQDNIMGDITLSRDDRETNIYIPTIKGNVCLLSSKKFLLNIGDLKIENDYQEYKNKMHKDFKTILEEKNFSRYKLIDKFQIDYPNDFSKTGFSNSKLYSKPLVLNGKLFQAYARDTYYDYPAIVCIDLNTKKIEWYASDNKRLSSNYGNIRTELLEYSNEIIFINPYSNELVGLSKETGDVIWIVTLGRAMFQQWASPIVYKNGVYIPRHDGYLYKVNAITKKREWGIYLGEAEDAGVVFNDEQTLINEEETTDWNISKGFSLLSTPTISKGNLIVGSDEGYLYCITNI